MLFTWSLFGEKGLSPNQFGEKKLFKLLLLLHVNFENLTIKLHVLIIPLILVKFQKDQILIVMSSIKCLTFKIFMI